MDAGPSGGSSHLSATAEICKGARPRQLPPFPHPEGAGGAVVLLASLLVAVVYKKKESKGRGENKETNKKD